MLGGGSVPGQLVPGWCVSITPARRTVDQLASELRNGTPAILGRIKQDRLLIDVRTVHPSQDVALVNVFESLA